MYTILINENGKLSKTRIERIIQGSSNAGAVRFLIKKIWNHPVYGDMDMSKFAISLELLSPISHSYLRFCRFPGR